MTKIGALTGLRFFAAAMILLFHLPKEFGIPAETFSTLRLSQGVSLFFVLSGFVLAYAYPALPTVPDVGRFYRARIARVWPSHIMMLFVVVVLGTPIIPTILVANATLLHAWIPSGAFYMSYNNVSWSLSTEMGFYMLFPLLIHNFDNTWRWKLAISLLIATWLALAAGAYDVPEYDRLLHVDLQGLVALSPLARLFEFVLGMTMAVFWVKYRNSVVLPWAVWVLLEVAAAALFLFNTWIVYAAVVSIVPRSVPIFIWLGSSFSPGVSAALLLIVIAQSKGPLAVLLSSRVLVYLGELSFAIYLVHPTVFRLFLNHRPRIEWLPTSAELAAAMLAILLAAMALHHLVEVPAQKAIRGLPGSAKARVLGAPTS